VVSGLERSCRGLAGSLGPRCTIPLVEPRVRVRVADDLGNLELIDAQYPRPHFARHAHPTYAIGAVYRGANRFTYRGAFHSAPAGTLCTVTPDEAHSVEPTGDRGFAYRCFYPSADLIRRVAESVSDRRLSHTFALLPVLPRATPSLRSPPALTRRRRRPSGERATTWRGTTMRT
jgi:hypothetical protein